MSVMSSRGPESKAVVPEAVVPEAVVPEAAGPGAGAWAGASRRGLLAGAVGAGVAVALPGVKAYGVGGGSAGAPPVLLTEQASRRLLVLDPRRRVWDPAADPSVVRWQFSPLGDPRYEDLAPDVSWVYPSEAKVRVHRRRTYVLTTASFGFAAVVAYPSGERYWAGAVGPGDDLFNPHSAEILPDGNVAVACSTGALVRLYAASQGPRATRYAEATLKGAHGLYWDRARRVLWALGDDELVTYEVGGVPARPELTRTSAVALPVGTPGRTPGGHDLFPVARRPGRLWVTTNAAVFQYDKARAVFVRDFAGAELISRKSVKCVGDDPRTGQVVTAVPESGLGETWWTTTVSVHRPESSYKLVDGGIYKARWWLPA
ncbi:WD40 repeat domain-containing protein OS=Streptomyces alboniger OX=132473 GN=CP975_14625 PE=4 SV=1 [Streptomyces alboniger]